MLRSTCTDDVFCQGMYGANSRCVSASDAPSAVGQCDCEARYRLQGANFCAAAPESPATTPAPTDSPSMANADDKSCEAVQLPSSGGALGPLSEGCQYVRNGMVQGATGQRLTNVPAPHTKEQCCQSCWADAACTGWWLQGAGCYMFTSLQGIRIDTSRDVWAGLRCKNATAATPTAADDTTTPATVKNSIAMSTTMVTNAVSTTLPSANVSTSTNTSASSPTGTATTTKAILQETAASASNALFTTTKAAARASDSSSAQTATSGSTIGTSVIAGATTGAAVLLLVLVVLAMLLMKRQRRQASYVGVAPASVPGRSVISQNPVYLSDDAAVTDDAAA